MTAKRYVPGELNRHDVTPRQIAEYLQREVAAISDALRVLAEGRQDALGVEPVRPREGQVVYADGSGWDPGSGAGLYLYRSAAWELVATENSASIPVSALAFSATDRIAGRASAGAGAGEELTCTAFGRSLLDDASAAAARTTLGLDSDDDVQHGRLTLNGTVALLRLGQKLGTATVSDYGGAAFHVYSATADHSPLFEFNRSRHTTVGSHTAVQADDTLGYVIFRGSDGSAFQNAALIKALVDGAVSSGDMPGRLEFYTTADGSASPTLRFVIKSDGRMYGTALHNNAGAVTGTTNQYIASGTYTPTVTNGSNVASSTARPCQWIRVGNVVTVSGAVNIDPTAAATLTSFELSLPIASDFTQIYHCGGGGANFGSAPVTVNASVANNTAVGTYVSAGTAAEELTFVFAYVVL